MVWTRDILLHALGPRRSLSFQSAVCKAESRSASSVSRRVCSSPWWSRGSIRCYSSDDISRKQQVTVHCRSNGSITLDIFRQQTSPSPIIIIYLPPGVANPSEESNPGDNTIASTLSDSAKATVVRINYRSGRAHPFPTPIHDVLTGYDWILENLIAGTQQNSRKFTKLGVCGELFGGALTTALALTECRLGGHRIGAAVMSDPVVDWLFPNSLDWEVDSSIEDLQSQNEEDVIRDSERALDAEISNLTKTGKKKKPKKPKPLPPPDSFISNASYEKLLSSELLSIRSRNFPHASSLFDRFASPVLFFRSPSAVLPRPASEDLLASLSPTTSNPPSSLDPETPATSTSSTPLEEEIDLAALVPTSDFDPLSLTDDLSHDEFSTSSDVCVPAAVSGQREDLPDLSVPPPASLRLPRLSRTYHRTYPPSSASLSLPFLCLHTSTAGPLATQHAEFAALVRRGVAREYVKRNGGGNMDVGMEDEKAQAEELRRRAVQEGQERMKVVSGEFGRWSNDGQRVKDVGRWLRATLGTDS